MLTTLPFPKWQSYGPNFREHPVFRFIPTALGELYDHLLLISDCFSNALATSKSGDIKIVIRAHYQW
jgi:hypothetical protein